MADEDQEPRINVLLPDSIVQVLDEAGNILMTGPLRDADQAGFFAVLQEDGPNVPAEIVDELVSFDRAKYNYHFLHYREA